jgi:uncharacterized protein (DUF362 family)/NAD-dependent dihydropyrimidine dehydrogenase PreA subunit
MSAKVSVVKCNSYEGKIVEQAIRDSVDLLGGITCFVRPQSRVLLKPNLLMSKPPEYGITTHPEIVRAVIHILKEINCKIALGDSPSVWDKYLDQIDQVYEISGISRVCKEESIELIKFDKRRMRDKFPLAAALDECDYLINLPKFKTHGFTLISGSIKNLFGLVPGTYKTELHKNHFQPPEFARVLVDIYEEVRPALTIIDGVLAMEGDGPGTSGQRRQLNLLLAGSDCVALDTVMAKMMGITGREVLSTKEAALRGLGQGDLSKIKIEGEFLEGLNIRPFALPNSSLKRISELPKPIQRILKSLIRYYPYSLRSKCSRCGHCIGICPSKCVKLLKNRINFDYKKCIACFCCQEVCPEAAISVKKSILAKLIGL